VKVARDDVEQFDPSHPGRTSETVRLRSWLVVAGLTLGTSLWLVVPWHPHTFSPDPPYLDTSWMVMLHDAFLEKAAFGSEFVMTYGPWGFVGTRAFYPGTFGWLVVSWLAVAFALWLGAFAVARAKIRNRALAAAWVIAVIATAVALETETVVIALATLLLVIGLGLEVSRLSYAAVLLLSVALAWLGQVKFTYFVLASGLMVIVLVSALLRRGGSASAVAAFVGTSLALWLLAGQSLGGIWDFLHSSLVVSGGYTQAMSLGNLVGRKVTLVFVAAAAVVIALVGLSERASARSFPARTVGIAWILFVLFKEGFVRQDPPHVAIGLVGVTTVAVVVAPIAGVALGARGARLGTPLALVTVALATWWIASDRLHAPQSPLRYAWTQLHTADDVAEVFVHPRAARAERVAGWSGFAARVRERVPLPPTVGTADLYPHDQVVLIAHGIERSTRPVPQSYIAYEPRLATMNLEHLKGSRRPGTVFVDVAPIDGRWPLSEDGPSLVTLLADYRLSSQTPQYLVFKHVSSGGFRLQLGRRFDARLGDEILVPELTDAPIWIELQVSRTLVGRLEELLFKPAPLVIEARLADGRTVRHRLVPGLGETGFILSPYISDRTDLAELAMPSWGTTLAGAGVRSITITAVDDDLRGYSGELSGSFSSVLFKPPTQ
jgi:hypothetical protein